MLKKKLLIISLLTISFIFIFHYFSLKYSWYWTYRWLDIPVHILGGFWAALTALWISLKINHIESIFGYKKKALFVMLISVLIIAIFWEIFEVVFKVTFLNSKGYWPDTLSDISNSFVGGVIAFLYFIKNKPAKETLLQNKEESLSMILKH